MKVLREAVCGHMELVLAHGRKYGLSYVVFACAVAALFLFSYLWPVRAAAEDAAALIVYLIIALFVMSYPLNIRGVRITSALAVSVAVVMRYGVAAEAWMMFTAAAVTYLFVRERSVRHELYHWALIICTSWLAGGMYWLSGGAFGAGQDVKAFTVPVFVYAAASVVGHRMGSREIARRLRGEGRGLEWAVWKWELTAGGLGVCLGVLLYIVQDALGLAGVILLAAPLLAVSYVMRSYSTMEQMNEQLTSLNDLSLSFSSELDLSRTLHALENGLSELVQPDMCWILWLEGGCQLLHPLSVSGPLSERWREEWMNLRIPLGEGLSGSVALKGRTAVIERHAEAYDLYARASTLKSLQTLAAVPMRRRKKTVGVITLGSRREFAFDRRTLTLVEILANQAGVAIDNARRYEASERLSRRDELTGLYNYRAFEDALGQLLGRPQTRSVSLIMMDIDHFKRVNDTYGHVAGNDVLKQLARLLQQHVRETDVVARYGGEEFVIILPNTAARTAEVIAERLREKVRVHPFVVEGEAHTISITVSMGIAHYPEQAEDGVSLVRHADRAMYYGSKQRGRNRVTLYQPG